MTDNDRTERCIHIVESFWAETASLDTDRLLALFSEDAVSHDPVGTPPVIGHDGHRALFDSVSGLFRSIVFDTALVYAAPPYVSVRWTAEAILLSGETRSFGGLDVFRIELDDHIHEHWGFWNPDTIHDGQERAS